MHISSISCVDRRRKPISDIASGIMGNLQIKMKRNQDRLFSIVISSVLCTPGLSAHAADGQSVQTVPAFNKALQDLRSALESRNEPEILRLTDVLAHDTDGRTGTR